MKEPARLLEERYASLQRTRSQIEDTWQTIARYCIPRKASFQEVDTTTNLRRERQVLDSTAPRALEMFASFLHSSLSSPTSQWFDIVIRGQNPLDAQRDVTIQKWAEAVKKAAYIEMIAGPTNVYTALHELYIDLGAFGTGVLYVEWDDRRDGLRFTNFHLASVVLDQAEDGDIDTLMRRVPLTPRQARQKWPDRPLGKNVEAAEKTGENQPIEFLHAVFPASDNDLLAALPEVPGLQPGDWVSVWTNVAERMVVAIGRYETKPFVAPRWYKVRQEIYGRSPAMTVLGDVIMVNRMAATVLRGAEKLVDPPILIPDGALVSPLRYYPGGVSYTDGAIDPRPLLPPGASRIELGDALIEKRQEAIREGFFVPLFITPDSPVKTATQVLQEVDERNRATAPMITRLHHELFDPLIRRVLSLLAANGRLPPPPSSVQNVVLDVEFVSPVVASQRMQEGLALMRLFESVAPWYQVDRGAFDWLSTDAVVRALHAATGAPASVLNSPDKVNKVREARQSMEQAVAQQQQAIAGVDALAKLQAAQK